MSATLTPAAEHEELARLEMPDCDCPPYWHWIVFPDGSRIRWLWPCRHVWAAMRPGSRQQHHTDYDEWAARLLADNPVEFRGRPPPRWGETSVTLGHRLALMELREALGQDIFDARDRTELPQQAAFPDYTGGQSIGRDSPENRPMKRTMTALQGKERAALVPAVLLTAVKEMVLATGEARLVVLSRSGRYYSVLSAEASPAQLALAVVRVAS